VAITRVVGVERSN